MLLPLPAHQQRHRTVDHYAAFVAHKFDVPVLEDRAAIQLAISEVVGAMAQNFMDPKRGGKILYGLQLALNGMKHPQEIVAPEPVRELCQNAEGEDIGPEMTVYEEGEEFPDDEEDDEEDDDGQAEQEQDSEGEVPGISVRADGNITSGQPEPKTLHESHRRLHERAEREEIPMLDP